MSGSCPVTIASGKLPPSPYGSHRLVARHPSRVDQIPSRLLKDRRRPVDLEEARRRRAQKRVPKRERKDRVRIENDLEGRRKHSLASPTSAARSRRTPGSIE